MKPKIGDTVQFKKSGITGTVEKILRGVYVVKTHESRLPAWPEELIVVGLSEVSLDKEMEEHQKLCDEIMAIQGIEPIEAEDEDGNVINATKIVLEKKKKEYPKTYEECLSVLQIKGYDIVAYVPSWTAYEKTLYQEVLKLRELIICRDAYWKIAGDEMGLGKPWEPDYTEESWEQGSPIKYVIYYTGTNITKERKCTPSYVLSFPTEEMRDAFYENFKGLIESVKELL